MDRYVSLNILKGNLQERATNLSFKGMYYFQPSIPPSGYFTLYHMY